MTTNFIASQPDEHWPTAIPTTCEKKVCTNLVTVHLVLWLKYPNFAIGDLYVTFDRFSFIYLKDSPKKDLTFPGFLTHQKLAINPLFGC